MGANPNPEAAVEFPVKQRTNSEFSIFDWLEVEPTEVTSGDGHRQRSCVSARRILRDSSRIREGSVRWSHSLLFRLRPSKSRERTGSAGTHTPWGMKPALFN